MQARRGRGAASRGATAVLGCEDRGRAVAAMADALAHWLADRDDIGAVLGLGGSGNTALVTAAMRALPVGVPKLMVSTVASGNVAAYVGPNDIAMMYSVTDVAGLNAISRKVIGNAAHAAAGMAKWTPPTAASDRPGVGMTMFGVTTECVTPRGLLEPTTRSMSSTPPAPAASRWRSSPNPGLIAGMIDVTTTEVADRLMGGVFPAPRTASAPSRAPAALCRLGRGLRHGQFRRAGDGAGPLRERNLYVHNPQVTLMRTTPEENTAIGEWIAERLNACDGEVRFLLPLGGVSAIDAPGMPFHDPEADAALFAAIRATLADRAAPARRDRPTTSTTGLRRALVEQFREIAKRHEQESRRRVGNGRRPERARLLMRASRRWPRRQPIIGGGAGTGLSAKCEEAGGIDLIVIYNSGPLPDGRARLAGRACSPTATPTRSCSTWRARCCRWSKHTPVLAGVNGTDPFVIMDHHLDRLKALGFAGVQNFPTVGPSTASSGRTSKRPAWASGSRST
jgi:uncharacterized protein (UPF0261 family)